MFVSQSMQRISFSCSSSRDSVMMTKSSAYRFSQRHPVQNSWERPKASRMVMTRRRLRQQPCWTLIFTLNSLLRLQPTCTPPLTFSYIFCMSRTGHSSTPNLRRAHHMTCLSEIFYWGASWGMISFDPLVSVMKLHPRFGWLVLIRILNMLTRLNYIWSQT